MNTDAIIYKAYSLRNDERFCTCCKKPLTRDVRFLELDQRSNVYHDRGGIPDGLSQGWFPFGLSCARKELKRASS